MKNPVNTTKKTKNTMIALILLLSIALTSVAYLSPTVHSATYPVYAYVNFTPNPIGVNQTGLCIFNLDRPSPTAVAGFNPQYNWNGFMLTITAPDGTNTTFGPFTSDATGGYFQSFTPTQVGNYTITFNFPGQTITSTTMISGTNYFSPASATTTFEVTTTPVPTYQTPPLPTAYWSFPIYGENKGWEAIAGNWLMETYNLVGGPFNPYTTGPTTAHIDWTIPQYMGGVVGENQINPSIAEWNYYMGPTYQPYWAPPMVMDGRLYYMEREVPGNGWVGMACIDLSTGKQIWFQPVSVIGQAGPMGGGATATIYGELFDAESINGHGILPYFWNTYGGNYTMFDANSGLPILTAYGYPTTANSPGVTGPRFMYDTHGSFIAFYINGAHHWLCCWNSTLLIQNVTGVNSIYTPPVGAAINWTNGIQFNVTIPVNYPGEIPSFAIGLPMGTQDVIYAHTGSISFDALNDTVEAYSATTGAQLWYRVFNGSGSPPDPYIPGTTPYEFFGPTADGVICVYQKASHQWYGYNTNTGAYMWGPTNLPSDAWNTFIAANAAYGYLYCSTYAGHVYAINLQTGVLNWTYTAPNSGFNTPYGANPLAGDTNKPFSVFTIADGKLYIQTGEHTPNSPYWVGGALYCINATDGTGIFSMSGWWTPPVVVADGQVISINCYDGMIYDIGKGQTATTVDAPMTAIPTGSNLVIQGSVTDQSPGAKEATQVAMYPHGVPCVSDASMTPWMEYLYQQKPMPTNSTGVQVSIDAIDPNNNYIHIGSATTDANGIFHYTWTPPNVPGTYSITATFVGTNSYWGSNAETNVVIQNTPTPSPTASPVSLASTQNYIMSIGIAIIIVIIIIGAILAVLVLRKRP